MKRIVLPAGAVARTVGWLTALLVAVGLGLLAVGMVGDAVRGSGPLGAEVIRVDPPSQPSVPASPPPGTSDVRADLTDDFGTFTVACQGPLAAGVDAFAKPGWRVVRFEPGPDDDVEAVFASDLELVEIEAFCNRGRPEVAELDRSQVNRDRARTTRGGQSR